MISTEQWATIRDLVDSIVRDPADHLDTKLATITGRPRTPEQDAA